MSNDTPATLQELLAAPPAPAPAKHKVLAVGSTEQLDEFFAFYVLHLMHGDDLFCAFSNTSPSDEKTAALEATGYERLFLFNHTGMPVAKVLQQTFTFVQLSNLPRRVTQDTPPLIVTDQQNDCHFTHPGGDKRHVHMVRSSTPAKYPMTSLLLEALYLINTQHWFVPSQDAPTITTKILRFNPHLKDESLVRLYHALQMLESLPGYAHRAAVEMHDVLEGLDRSFKAFDEFFGI